MKKLIILLLVLAGSVWLGIQLVNDPGYVLIARKHWIAEMPLWFGVFILLVLFFLLHYSLPLLRNIVQFPKHAYLWLKKRREQQAQEKVNQDLLGQILQPSIDPETLLCLLPELHRRRLLSLTQLRQLKEKAFAKKLHEIATTGDAAALRATWQNIPKSSRQCTDVLISYLQGLIRHHQDEEAARWIKKALKKNWDNQLVYLYGLITTAQQEHLTLAESWLKDHPNDACLLLTLGRLCTYQQLWGKADNYFKASLAIQPQAETYQALGELLEKLNNADAAMQCYKKALG